MNGGAFGTATAAAIDALKSGKDVGGPAEEPSGEAPALESAEEETSPEVEATPDESSVDADSTEGEEAPESKPADIEEIILTDDEGKKKLKVDWNDREKIKKYIQMAAGMRKYQAERDKLKAEYEGYRKQSLDKVDSYEALNTAWQSRGLEGVIDLLAGEGSYGKFKADAVREAQFLSSASPEAKKAYEIEQQLLQERREREKLTKEVEENLRRSREQQEAAQQKEVESLVYPAFDKYRFQGKLGDEVLEHSLDEAVWTQTLARLEKLPEGSLTGAVVDREFRSVAATFNKAIQKQASTEARRVVDTKKAQAKEAVTAAAARGMKDTKSSNEVREKIAKGDLKSAFLDMINGRKL
jgi:predicted methyltransferase